MNKNISCIGIALVIAMLVFGLAGCPTGSNPTPNPPQTNSEADLLTLAVSNSSDTSVAIGDPIYDDDWYAFADSGGFTGLWAEATGTVAITSVDSSFDAKIALTVSDGASAFISGPVISANAVPADNTFVPYDPAATITVQDNRYLYVQVISENTKIMNFYRFKVSLTELGSSILINSITVGSVEADPGVPGSTDWPASANYGTVVLSPATNSGVVTASPAVTGAGGPTILYGRSASATPAPELSASLSGAATPFTDGTFIFVKVTAQNELTSAYYIIQVEIGRNANLDPDEQVNSTTSPPTTTYGGVTATGNNAGSLGTPSATLPISSANIGGVSVSYIFGEIPAGGFAVMAKTQADDAAVAFATGPANAAASALVFANAAGTGVDKSGTVKPASADEILFVRVTAGNGTTVQYYALTLLYNKSGNIKFGIPTIDLASKYIDPIWNDPDLDVYNIDGRTYDTGENVLEYRNAVASGDKDTYTYGDARCLWDDTGVYVYIRVAKAYPAVGSIPAGTSNFFGTTASYQHMWDSVEVFINESVTANGDVKTDVANITTTGGGQYRLSPGPGTTMNRSGDPTPATTGTGFGNTAAYPASGWAVAAGDPGSLDNRPGYVVIMKVPFRFLSAYPVANGKKIGLDLQINVANANGSANTGRIGVMVWKNRTASNYENCTLWGVATLTGKLVDLPAISGQPEASHTYVIADSPTAVPLSVTATLPSSGGVLSYQWYSASSATAAGTAITGEISATYTPPINHQSHTWYYVVVTNTNQGQSMSVTSNRAEVIVQGVNAAMPVINSVTVDPIGALTVDPGVKPGVEFTIVVDSTKSDSGTLSYQWYSATALTGGTPVLIVGATLPSYTTSVATASTNNFFYVEVTNTITDNGDGGNKTATATSDPRTRIYVVDPEVTVEHIITFDKNNTDTSGNTEADPISKTSVAGDVGTLPVPPTRSGGWSAGLTFDSWNTKSDGTGDTVTADYHVNDDLTVYAQWVYHAGTPYVVGDTLVVDAPAMTTNSGEGGTQGTWSGSVGIDGSVTYTGGAIRYMFPAEASGYDYITLEYVHNGNLGVILKQGSTSTDYHPLELNGSASTNQYPSLVAAGSVKSLINNLSGANWGLAMQRNNGSGTVKFTKATFTNGNKYAITFDVGYSGGETIPSIQAVEGVALGTLPVPVARTGYKFDYWMDGTTPVSAATIMPSHQLDLTESWSSEKTVDPVNIVFDQDTIIANGSSTVTVGDGGSSYTLTYTSANYGNVYATFSYTFPGDIRLSDYSKVTFTFEGLAGDAGNKNVRLLAAASGLTGYKDDASNGGSGGNPEGTLQYTNAATVSIGASDVTLTIDATKAVSLNGNATVQFAFYIHASNVASTDPTSYKISNVSFTQ